MTVKAKRPEFSHCSARVATFVEWPENHPIRKEDLARAGFYYGGLGDLTRCFVCGGGLRGWQPTDDPFSEHARWYPECQFVRFQSQSDVNNSLDSDRYDGNGHDKILGNGHDKILETETKRCKTVVKHREMADVDTRLATFEDWPNNHVTKCDAAEAGFFYSGLRDSLRCYHCGGGLSRWQPADDPWIEHARFFSKCDFLLEKRGQDFVDVVCHLSSVTSEPITKATVVNELIARKNRSNTERRANANTPNSVRYGIPLSRL